MKADEILKGTLQRMELAKKERDAPEGERSMKRACDIFNAWTGAGISEQMGWRFMLALKLAREIQGEPNVDDYVDVAGYSALLGECSVGYGSKN